MPMHAMVHPWWVSFGHAVFMFVQRLRRSLHTILIGDYVHRVVWMTAVLLTILDGVVILYVIMGWLDYYGIFLYSLGTMLLFLIGLFLYSWYCGLYVAVKKHPHLKTKHEEGVLS